MLGLLAEEYDPVEHRQLGNFPQAFSHLALINTALNLEQHGPAQQRRAMPPNERQMNLSPRGGARGEVSERSSPGEECRVLIASAPRQSPQPSDGEHPVPPPAITAMKDTHIIDRLSDDHLWDQVILREPGDFLYAVTTMGIYCRPGCPSPSAAAQECPLLPQHRRGGDRRVPGLPPLRPEGERARLAQAVVRDACAFIEFLGRNPVPRHAGHPLRLLALPFPAHVPRPHRPDAAQLRRRRPRQTPARRAGRRRPCRRCGGRRRLRLGKPGLRKDRRIARHDARRTAPGRGRGGDPHRLRRLPVRPSAGRRHRQGRLLHRLCRTG